MEEKELLLLAMTQNLQTVLREAMKSYLTEGTETSTDAGQTMRALGVAIVNATVDVMSECLPEGDDLIVLTAAASLLSDTFDATYNAYEIADQAEQMCSRCTGDTAEAF